MTDLWYLIYDTLADAQRAAGWILAGSKAKRILIVGLNADAPDDLMMARDMLVIRARDIIEPSWYVVTAPLADSSAGRAPADGPRFDPWSVSHGKGGK